MAKCPYARTREAGDDDYTVCELTDKPVCDETCAHCDDNPDVARRDELHWEMLKEHRR